ncbi:hypothetical protein OHD37_13520 [Escherichia coli]|nr:hypothetical protein [Escherichia coli]
MWRRTSLADLEKTYPEFDFIIHKHHLEKWMNGGLTAENVKKLSKKKAGITKCWLRVGDVRKFG